MKRFILSFVAVVAAITMYGVPAYPGWQTKTLSDGSTIEVRQVGDEFCSYWESKDGKLVTEQADGTFVKSDKPLPTNEEFQACRTRAREMRNLVPDFASNGTKRVKKSVGTTPNLAPKGVVILVNFSDSEMNEAHTNAVFDDMCNSENCQNNTYNNKKYGSAAQYFADQSNGAYRPVFDVFGPVNIPNNVEYYGEDGPEQSDGSRDHDLYMGDFVVDAVLAAEAQGCDFSQYDSDDDGYVDFVYFIFAGKGQANGGSVSTIWPHNSSLIGQLYYGRTHGRTDYYINSESDYNLLIMDGKAIDNYACSAELDGSGNLDGIGTLCHEFGHVMGLPDFYDTSYGYNYENHLTPNEWNIMDGGSYNGGSHCPPNYDPWEKYFFGWIDPINPGNEGANVTLYPNGSENYNVYQINSSGTKQGPTSSGPCYYLENRQKSGWDSFLPASGMVIWRLDFNASAWSNNKPNHSSTSGSPLYTLVCSSGTMIGQQWVYNETKGKWEKINDGTNNVFPGKDNVTSWSGVSGKPVTGITQVGNNITFQYKDGAISSSCAVPTDIQAETTDATATLVWEGEADGYEIRYLEGEYTGEVEELFSGTTEFDDDLAGWTTIDADGDGHTWNAKSWYVYSESYINNVGALTPDNYLVSPKIRLGGSISFYASGASTWCAEHFGVAISTKSNTDAADFTMVSQEWVADSAWTKYTVDLSAYSGTGYVAIRHFNITDMFILAVAEIEITAPEETIIPWSVVEGISEKQHTIQNLKDSTLYTAQVRSRCGEAFSEWSTSVVFTTKAKVVLPPCDEPTDVQAMAVTDSTATISWTGEADGYEIQYKEGTEWTTIEGINETEYILTGLKDSTLYTAQVRSRCGEAYSEWTESVVFTTLAKPEPIVPEKPKWTEWAYYDDGTCEDAIGTGGSTFFWGVMFPANTLGGDTLSKIAVYEKAEANTQAITIDIYSDGATPIAANKIYTETVAPAGVDGFHEITLQTPVVIDTLKNVWVILSEGTDGYPALVCTNTGDPNGRWVSLDGTNWMDLIEANSTLNYTFMIRAYIGPVEHKQVEGVDNVQGDNVQGTKVLREGQLLIIRDGKTYTILGTKIEK